MKYTILVAEDDDDVIAVLRLYLEGNGYQAIFSNDGVNALTILQQRHIDLGIIDIGIPHMDGFELIRRTRMFSTVPIIVLSARNQDSDKILGLNIGADEYLTKPFNPLELIAHIQATLRRRYQFASDDPPREKRQLMVGKLRLDLDAATLTKDGVPITLTLTEYKILVKMMCHPGHVFTKGQLYASINDEFSMSGENTMMVHISNLRDKIEDNAKMPKYIRTIRGIGYRIENPVK